MIGHNIDAARERLKSSRSAARKNSAGGAQPSAKKRRRRALAILLPVLGGAAMLGLWAGYREINLAMLRNDELARNILFRLLPPRVLMSGMNVSTQALLWTALRAVVRQ